MKKVLQIGLTAFLAMAGIATAANYGVFVGLNTYNSSYVGSDSWLDGCVPDAMHVYTNATQRGDWTAGNSQILTNALGTRTRIRQAISNYAATAVSGDVFLYFHSSHGGNDDWPYSTSVFLCAYDADYSDTLLAQDLSRFATGVKVVVMVDACHSGGLFQSRSVDAPTLAAATPASWDLAARVTALMEADRAAKIARGVKDVDKLLSASEIGWITAANYDQYSWDDTDGGAFTTAAIDGWSAGTCDNATYGNQDGYATFYEVWNYAKDVAIGYPGETDPYDGTSYETDAQAFNTNVLKSIVAGIAGDGPVADRPPTIALDPAGTNKTAAFDVPVSFTVTATDADGLAVSLSASGLPAGATAPAANGTGTASTTFNWTPTEAQIGVHQFSFSATDDDGTTVQGVKITVTDGSTTADLLISEYIEGSSNNKAVEIFNGTGAAVDLAAGSYAVRLYANGAATPSATINLTGTLANGDVHVVANPSANAAILAQADQTSGSLTHNGNDAVALAKGGVDLDVVGTIGVNVTNLIDVTKVRLSSVSAGNTTYTPAEWDNYAVDTTGYLGSHVFGGGGATTSAPAFNALGGQSATVGAALAFAVSATGYPLPTLALQGTTASGGYTFTAGTGQLAYTPPEADLGDRTFTFTASNAAGVATQTVAVTVSAAPVTVPTASIANLASTSFTVNWTAITGGSTYQVQVATDSVFAVEGGDSLMSNAGFETGDGTDWDKFETEYAVVSTAPQEGTYHATCTATGTRDLMQTVDIAGDGSTAYEVSFYYKKPLSNGNARIWGSWAAGGQVSGDSLQPTTYLPAAAEWTKATYTLVPSNGANVLNFEVRTYTGATVDWDNFFVGVAGSGRTPRAILVDQSVAALTYGVTGLEPETTYYVRVRGTGGTWSDVVSATTPASGGDVTPDPEPIVIEHGPGSGATMSLQIPSTVGVTYRLEYTTNLLESPVWLPAATTNAAGSTVTLEDSDPADGCRYYRIVKP
ncbi:MAG: lamin tail domain-containing protein [Kiritimatiellia bacterium]